MRRRIRRAPADFPMSRTSDARERLIEASTRLIWESSYGSTSVDDICERAGVKKGSFYHFFSSKSDLALAILDAQWEARRVTLNAIFSPLVPPLERIYRHIEFIIKNQTEQFTRTGRVCGCPLFALGCELGTQDDSIRRKVEEILSYYQKLYESALRDAMREGSIREADPVEQARIVGVLIEGTLTQARIANDLTPARKLRQAIDEVLGVRAAAAPPATT